MILLDDIEAPKSTNIPYVRIKPSQIGSYMLVLIAQDSHNSIIISEKDAVDLAHIILEELT